MKSAMVAVAMSCASFVGSVGIANAADGHILRAGSPVRGEYIVLLQSPAADTAAKGFALAAAHGGRVTTSYSLIPAFVLNATEVQAVAMSRDPLVRSVEENARISVASTYSGMLAPLVPGGVASRWGLDRIDQPTPSNPRLDDTYTMCADGAGVRAYVLDTGVFDQHPEYLGRVDDAPELQSYFVANGLSTGQGPCWMESDTIDIIQSPVTGAPPPQSSAATTSVLHEA